MVFEQTVSTCIFTSMQSLGKSVREHLDVNLDCKSPHNSCLYKTLYRFSRCLKSSVLARQDGYASIFSLSYITSENRASSPPSLLNAEIPQVNWVDSCNTD